MAVLAVTIQGPSADQSSVKVSGKGSAFDTPDVASFTITVQEVKNTSKEAADSVSAKVTRILEILTQDGAKKNEVKASRLTVGPKTEYVNGTYVQVGQQATETIQVSLKNVSPDGIAVGKLVDDVATIDRVQFSQMTFDLADKTNSKRRARAAAYAEARGAAQQFAQLSGLSLGRALSIEESPRYVAPLTFMYSGRPTVGDSQTQVPLGQYETTSDVTVTFRLN